MTEESNLQQQELAAAYASELAIQDQSLQQEELSAAYATALPKELERTTLAMELERTTLTLSSFEQTELGRFETFQQESSTRASDAQLDASTSSPRTSRKQSRALKTRIFPSLFREIVILMIQSLTLHSLSFLISTSSLNCTSLSFQSSFRIGWAPYFDEKDELLTTFGEKELENKAKLRRTCREEENDKQEELQILLWEQELEKHLADKSFWVNQLQTNASENEKNKQLDANKKLQEKNFQSLILEKLVALLPEKHFALAASTQFLGNEAWEKSRETSEEISFDKVRGKELPPELRRAQLDCKDLRSASFRALCPSNFEENNLQQATFKEESFTASTFPEKTFYTTSFADSSFTEETFTTNNFTKSSLTENNLTKNSFSKKGLRKKSFDKTNFSENTFLENNFSENSLEAQTFSPAASKAATWKKRPLPKQLRRQQLGGQELPADNFEKSNFTEETFSDSSLEESSFQKSNLEKSSLDRNSLHKHSFAKHSFTACSFNKSNFEESSFDTSSFPRQNFSKSSLDKSSLQPNKLRRQL